MKMINFSLRKQCFIYYLMHFTLKSRANDILGCGGFVQSHVSLDFAKIEIGLYTKDGSIKEKTECAPTNGYYFLPLYEKGDYILKVHPPAGWSFEPSQVNLQVDGVSDQCSRGQDINFVFNGFGITGQVITAGQKIGPSGIAVQLVSEKEGLRETVTATGGDFHFTPVIPGKYTLKASHPRWKLDPAQAIVQVKEGNTVLPVGVLAVKGYDVRGSVISYGNPIKGFYVLLYSKEESPKFRVEGCKTALLQGVPDSPICHSVTDASGEFSFGLVPAGEYKLVALSKAPGQAIVSYNVRTETVTFSVKHDSLYIKNAFEVISFTVVGSVVKSVGGSGISGVQVLLDNKPVDSTDSSGKYTLAYLQPGVYSVSFQNEQCEIDKIKVSISSNGVVNIGQAKVARWRVCGSVTPPDDRDVTISREGDRQTVIIHVSPENGGKWCTYLMPGVYTAKVEVTEEEQGDGLQFYPIFQKITVSHGPQDGIAFSQLKAKLSGTVECKVPAACDGLTVTLRPLSVDGLYVGKPLTTQVKDGQYQFEDVLPGSAEVSVPATRLCWAETTHNVALSGEDNRVPAFIQTGYLIAIRASHALQVEYSSKGSRGNLDLPAGLSEQCVSTAGVYTLTPRGCHLFKPAQAQCDTNSRETPMATFTAIAHAMMVKVISPEPADDLILKINLEDGGIKEVGPLVPLKQPDGSYVFEHTLYMAEGEVAVVSARSSLLVVSPPGPRQLVGVAACPPRELMLRAARGLLVAGQLQPPVQGVTVTLSTDDLKLSQVTSKDGKYSFGPLDATKKYTITAEKESYVFTTPDAKGTILAHKLAEISVELVDDVDGTPLQGGVVSVSGGSYRRNAVSGPDGRLMFPGLAPAQYYVKPLMKEYRFTPPHHILDVHQGKHHQITLRGMRTMWSCVGSLVSLSGAGWSRAVLVAAGEPAATCATEEATTDDKGTFRIRGLIPKCVYTIQLKDSKIPELHGLKLVKSPPVIEIKENKDIENVRLIAIQPHQITDANVLIYTPNIDHYKTLRLTLAPEQNPQNSLYNIRLDSTGYNQYNNPGLMYVLPRLPADNKTYIVQLESTLSKSTHAYDEMVHYLVSDGQFKFFNIQFLPKVRTADQELRQTSLLVIPLLGVVAFAFVHRNLLLEHLLVLVNNMISRAQSKPVRVNRTEVLDKASIEQIVSSVNAAGKKTKKKQ